MEQISFTNEYEDILFKIPLFQDLPQHIKTNILEDLDYKLYKIEKNDIIAHQNTPCKSLFVLLQGQLRVDIIDAFGNEVMIEDIVAPRAFATPHLFSKDNTLPATFTVEVPGVLLKATKDSVFKLISREPAVLKNFLCITGNCNECTTTRLRVLLHKSVRSRFIVYLLERKKGESNVVMIGHNQVQLADYLCVTRPALSKEINKMVKEGLISVEGKKIHLQKPELLRQLVS